MGIPLKRCGCKEFTDTETIYARGKKKKLYVAFKFHPQEGSLGPVVSPGAVGQSMEPQVAAKLQTGEIPWDCSQQTWGTLEFWTVPTKMFLLPWWWSQIASCRKCPGSKVNDLIVGLQGHIHLFYIILLESRICFWGGGSIFQLAKSLLSLRYVEKMWLELYYWKGLILCNISGEYLPGTVEETWMERHVVSIVQWKWRQEMSNWAVWCLTKCWVKKEQSYEPTAANSWKGIF